MMPVSEMANGKWQTSNIKSKGLQSPVINELLLIVPPAPASCSCRLPPASCLLPPASCLLPPAPAVCACHLLLPPAACHLLLPSAPCGLPLLTDVSA